MEESTYQPDEPLVFDVTVRGRILIAADPTTVTELDRLSIEEDGFDFEAAVEAGNAFTYWAGEGGVWNLRIYVGQDPPTELLSHTHADPTNSLKDCILRVPSGRLCVAGVGDEPVSTSAEGPVLLPSGNYRLGACLLDRESACEEFVYEQDGDGGLAGCAEQSCGCLGLGCLILFFCGFASLMIFGWPDIWTLLMWTVLACVSAIGLAFALSRLPGVQRRESLRKQFLRSHPHLVLVLKPLADDADLADLKGGSIPSI
jgi:hypothetical protein